MSVQIFVLLLTFFFRKGWSLRGGGKASYEVNSLEITRQNKLLVLHYTQECRQNNPLVILHPDEESQLLDGTFVLGVTKDITSPWWERWKMHPVPPRSCGLLSTIKWSLYFSDTSLLWCCADKCLLHAPFSKKSHLPNNSGTILVIWFWILETSFLMVTFNVTNWCCAQMVHLYLFLYVRKFKWDFLFFYFLTGKGKPYH